MLFPNEEVRDSVELESTVYVVDDDADSRRLIAGLLEAIFPRVQAFESANGFSTPIRMIIRGVWFLTSPCRA